MDLPDDLDFIGGEIVTIDWDLGLGFRSLVIALIVKMIDLICHCLVPTPAERWVKPDKDVQDVTDYMKIVGQAKVVEENQLGQQEKMDTE